MYIARRIARWCRALGHRRGFGVQSPFAYDFVTEVIGQRHPYYLYEDLAKTFPRLHGSEQRTARLLFRLANFTQPEEVFFDSRLPEAYRAFTAGGCRKARFVDAPTGRGLSIVMPDKELLDEALRQASQTSILVVMPVYEHARPREEWASLVGNRHVIQSFDLYRLGIIFFDQRRQKAHYLLNF